MSQSGQEGVQGTGQADSAQQGGQGSGAAGTEGQAGANGGQGTGADSAQQNSGQGTAQDTVSRADFERLQKQLSEADKKRNEFENELKTLKQKDLSDLEKAQTEAKDATERATALEGEIQKLRLANAFLASNTITWQNGEVALDIAHSKGYLEDVQDDKGVVDSKKLVAALKRLSEEHKYLVKADDGEGEQQQGQGSSGESGPARTNNAKDDKAKEQRLRTSFPALGRR